MNNFKFGLYTGGKTPVLFFTEGGSFAADAWIQSGGQNIGDVSGERFDAFTADDGKYCNIGTRYLAPVKAEELETLLPQAHEAFRLVVALYSFIEDNNIKLSFGKRMDWEMYKPALHGLFDKGYTFEELYEELTAWLNS